jgi:hypothetical protein
MQLIVIAIIVIFGVACLWLANRSYSKPEMYKNKSVSRYRWENFVFRLLQSVLFFVCFVCAYNIFEGSYESSTGIFFAILFLLLLTPLFAKYAIFVLSLPPYVDRKDMDIILGLADSDSLNRAAAYKPNIQAMTVDRTKH